MHRSDLPRRSWMRRFLKRTLLKSPRRPRRALSGWAIVSALILSVAAPQVLAEDKAEVQILKAVPARDGCAIGPEQRRLVPT